MPYTANDDDGWGDDGYAISPELVSPGVAPDVSHDVAPGVAPPVSRDVARDGTGPVSPDGDDAGWQDDRTGPLPAGRRETAPAVPGPEPGRRKDAVTAAYRTLLDDGHGLLAELRGPRPETLRQHRDHITGHKYRPEGKWAGIAFMAGYGAVTFPVKIIGNAMCDTGRALEYAGMRIRWAGDRFIRIGTAIAFLLIVVIVIVVFA
jgi:hypothetical protein